MPPPRTTANVLPECIRLTIAKKKRKEPLNCAEKTEKCTGLPFSHPHYGETPSLDSKCKCIVAIFPLSVYECLRFSSRTYFYICVIKRLYNLQCLHEIPLMRLLDVFITRLSFLWNTHKRTCDDGMKYKMSTLEAITLVFQRFISTEFGFLVGIWETGFKSK